MQPLPPGRATKPTLPRHVGGVPGEAGGGGEDTRESRRQSLVTSDHAPVRRPSANGGVEEVGRGRTFERGGPSRTAPRTRSSGGCHGGDLRAARHQIVADDPRPGTAQVPCLVDLSCCLSPALPRLEHFVDTALTQGHFAFEYGDQGRAAVPVDWRPRPWSEVEDHA